MYIYIYIYIYTYYTGAQDSLISKWRGVPQGSLRGQTLRVLLLRGTSALRRKSRAARGDSAESPSRARGERKRQLADATTAPVVGFTRLIGNQ